LKRSQLPASEQFPFGHGKEIYFWCFVVAIMIFAVGAGVSIYEGFHRLYDPAPVENFLINYIVLGLAIIFEGFAWYFAFKEFSRSRGEWGYFEAVHKGKDPSMFVVLFEDSAAMMGLLVALGANILSQLTGLYVFDAAASIIIGLILAVTAVWLAYETKSLLIGERASLHVVDGIRQLATDFSKIDHLNEILTMHMGPDFILVNISVDFVDPITGEEIEATVAKLDKAIKNRYSNVKRIFIEAESRH
jgi:cation diffusion facilitator family transporter